MKTGLKISLSIIIVLTIVIAVGMLFISRGLEEGRNLVINDVDLSLLDGGVYGGEYKDGRWSNKVNVTVKDHKITGIEIIKDVMFPNEDVTKEILNGVIENQNTNVDVISGATVTCKAYLKSIENALKK